jgi:hypothetical protein
MNGIGQNIAAFAASIIGLAMVAVILSKNSNTQGVLSSAGSSFSGIIGAAVSPVTGGSSGSSSASAFNSALTGFASPTGSSALTYL